MPCQKSDFQSSNHSHGNQIPDFNAYTFIEFYLNTASFDHSLNYMYVYVPLEIYHYIRENPVEVL